MKKYLLITLLLLASGFCIAQDQAESSKIDAEFFKALVKYDTRNTYIISDKGRLHFNYTGSYAGGIDINFKLASERKMRIKVNSLNFKEDKKLVLCNVDDSISLNDIRVTKIVSYNLIDNNVVKTKLSAKAITILKNGNDLMLDLDDLSLRNNCILDVEFSMKNLIKTKQEWNFQNAYYTIDATLEMSIPEIYIYNYEVSDSINFKIDHRINSSQGVFLGYYLPNTTLQNKLVGQAYYKIMKDKKREEEIEGARKIYCKYINHVFNIHNPLLNSETMNTKSGIRFRLLAINPITFRSP